MNVWSKLTTMARGQFRESAERVIDRHSLCIFEQEIIDCEQALQLARKQLALVMAEKLRLQRERDQHQQQRQQREQQALAALQQANESLALEVAEAITELERLLAEENVQIQKLEQREQGLKKRLRESAKTISDYRRELSILTATANAQAASGMLNGQTCGIDDRMQQMRGSLQRIRQRQQAWDDCDSALQHLDAEEQHSSLDSKLQQAGIQTGPDDARAVLERLRASLNSTNTGNPTP